MTDELKDQQRTCCDCGADFLFTVGEQVYYAQRNFREPRRCPACRPVKRAAFARDDQPRATRP